MVDITELNSYMIDQCKNYLYMLFKHNYYTREIWFKYLDYYDVNNRDKLIPVILPVFIINFLIFYIIALFIKKTTTHRFNKRAFYSKLF
tara:strand:+ start:432 stop:698 length:267 start_codon:yes stop_codon:yes gene_type:complete